MMLSFRRHVWREWLQFFENFTPHSKDNISTIGTPNCQFLRAQSLAAPPSNEKMQILQLNSGAQQ